MRTDGLYAFDEETRALLLRAQKRLVRRANARPRVNGKPSAQEAARQARNAWIRKEYETGPMTAEEIGAAVGLSGRSVRMICGPRRQGPGALNPDAHAAAAEYARRKSAGERVTMDAIADRYGVTKNMLAGARHRSPPAPVG